MGYEYKDTSINIIYKYLQYYVKSLSDIICIIFSIELKMKIKLV